MEREADLPRTYFDILWRLRRAPGRSLRMSRPAEITRSKSSRITHAVGRLEAAGLVAAKSRRATGAAGGPY
ncbi:hypothetical protein [Actinoallomurus acaciae]|uniref:MarR family transcriptional regulator n=1 Tax=Actinoallomurus acaciae TaxID=502577 RepID=A0ABV5YUE2_9ACTN